MDKFFIFAKNYSKALLSVFAIIVLTIVLFTFIDSVIHPPISVIAEFDELGPLYKKMPVYYKGYKIGTTSDVEPSNDYKTTLVTLVFYPDDLKLPENMLAKVKKLNNGIDYINLEYPKEPSKNMLKNGMIIRGATSLDIQSFMSAQVESGTLGSITENVDATLSVFTKVGEDSRELIQTITAMVNENRPSVKKSVENLNETTRNIKQMSAKLDKAVSLEKIDNTTSDIEQTAENIKHISADIELATQNMDKTMRNIDSTICEINEVASNINEITLSIKEALKKRKGLLKVLLGKTE